MRVLLICYYFPPLGGAGIGRPLSLFKELPQHGIECDILTVKPVAYRTLEPEHLETLDLSRIYRSGSTDPQRLLYLAGKRVIGSSTIDRTRVISGRFFPDSKIGWVRPAVRLGRTLLSARRYDAIISTSPPVSCHLVGRRLAEETSIPWIADFRDLWTAYDIESTYRKPSSIKRARDLLAGIRQNAHMIVAVNRMVAAYAGADQVVYNSYDCDYSKFWSLPDKGLPLVIGLFGSFNEVYPLRPMFELLAVFQKRYPSLRDAFVVEQVGNCDREWLQAEAAAAGVSLPMKMHGFLPRSQAIRQASSAHCFYLGVDSAGGAAFTTGRLFYLLASGRKILISAPPGGELAAVTKEIDQVHLLEPSRIDSGVEFLHRLYSELSTHQLRIKTEPDYATPFSSNRMVSEFAEIIQEITSGQH